MIYQKGHIALAAITIGQSGTAVVRHDVADGAGCSCGNNCLWTVRKSLVP